MKNPKIDESKLPEVMRIIDKAANLMEEKDCDDDEEARKELAALQEELQELTGNKKIEISACQEYWAYTSLESIARSALLGSPEKQNLTDEELTELIRKVYNLDFDAPEDEVEALNDYFLEVLEVETGLDNLTDYIYEPSEVGLAEDAGLDEVIAKVLADRK